MGHRFGATWSFFYEIFGLGCQRPAQKVVFVVWARALPRVGPWCWFGGVSGGRWLAAGVVGPLRSGGRGGGLSWGRVPDSDVGLLLCVQVRGISC